MDKWERLLNELQRLRADGWSPKDITWELEVVEDVTAGGGMVGNIIQERPGNHAMLSVVLEGGHGFNSDGKVSSRALSKPVYFDGFSQT